MFSLIKDGWVDFDTSSELSLSLPLEDSHKAVKKLDVYWYMKRFKDPYATLLEVEQKIRDVYSYNMTGVFTIEERDR